MLLLERLCSITACPIVWTCRFVPDIWWFTTVWIGGSRYTTDHSLPHMKTLIVVTANYRTNGERHLLYRVNRHLTLTYSSVRLPRLSRTSNPWAKPRLSRPAGRRSLGSAQHRSLRWRSRKVHHLWQARGWLLGRLAVDQLWP